MKRINILSTRLIQTTLVEQAREAGIDIAQVEFIRTEPSRSPQHAALVKGIPNQANLVFTSTNAVEALSLFVHEHNIPLPRGCRVFSVDGRTSLSINTLFPGYELVATSGSALSLAEQILKHNVASVYYICGNIRRDELPAMLSRNGIHVHELELYKTFSTPVEVKEEFDGLVFFSPSAVSSFFSMNTLRNNAVCFAIGETTANAIKEYTGNEIVVAGKPRQDHIIALIIKHYQNR